MGHCWDISHRPRGFFCSPQNQITGQLKPDCSPLNVNGSHMLTLSLLLLTDSGTSSLYFLSHISFMHTRTQFPLCRKMDGMFPNHRCCSTCESFAFFTTTHSRTSSVLYFFFFLLFSPVVITIVLQLRDNEERGILAMRRAINLLVY